MFTRNLPRRKPEHRIRIGGGIEIVVTDPERFEGKAIVVKFSNLTSGQPQVSIDAPREVPISLESKDH